MKLTRHDRPQLVPIRKKLERREGAREAKALTAARLEKSLERELIARLKSRAYGDQPLNINEDVWRAVLSREKEVEQENELEALGLESDDETDDEDEEELEGEREFVSDLEDESDLDDMEDYEMNGAEVRFFFHRSNSSILIVAAIQYGSDDDASELSNVEEGSEEDEDADDSEDEPVSKGKRKAIPAAAKGKGKAPAPVKRRSKFFPRLLRELF